MITALSVPAMFSAAGVSVIKSEFAPNSPAYINHNIIIYTCMVRITDHQPVADPLLKSCFLLTPHILFCFSIQMSGKQVATQVIIKKNYTAHS
jgi:hypothetical protein